MNLLADYITKHKLDECATLNALQGQGIISDLCVWCDDVAECDQARAVAWLEQLRKREAYQKREQSR